MTFFSYSTLQITKQKLHKKIAKWHFFETEKQKREKNSILQHRTFHLEHRTKQIPTVRQLICIIIIYTYSNLLMTFITLIFFITLLLPFEFGTGTWSEMLQLSSHSHKPPFFFTPPQPNCLCNLIACFEWIRLSIMNKFVLVQNKLKDLCAVRW